MRLIKEQEYRQQRTLPIDSDTLGMLGEYIKRGGPVVRDGKRFIFGINRHRAWQIVKECAEKAENENARLREQVARLQRQRQDQETFYEKKMAEQKTELEKVQERKLAEQQRAISKRYEEQKIELEERARQSKIAEQQLAAALKEQEERRRSERARAKEEAIADIRKQIQDLKKRIGQPNSEKQKTHEFGKGLPKIQGQVTNTGHVGELVSEPEKPRQDLRRERDRTSGSPPLPPLPHPLHPVSSLREIRRWLFRPEGEDIK